MKKEQKLLPSLPEYMDTPLWKETLSLEERLGFLISELTIEEKIQCLTIRAPEVERLGIKSFRIGGEAAHGVEARHDQEFNRDKPVCTTTFTQPIGLSATWDTALLEKVGIVTGTEARAVFQYKSDIGLSRWGPTVDMERDPRWGRTEEGYGEDPFLTGRMSSAYIQGLQGRDGFYLRCGATLKHFYANNEEKDREWSSSSLDMRNKREYYLEPFRRAITEGRAEAVMTAYNEINGIPAIINPEVRDLVKAEWGLKGHVVCDMGDMGQTVTRHKYFDTDAETLAYGLKAGIDCFNDPEEAVIAAAGEALAQGLITLKDINRAVRNTFSTKLRLGLYDSGGSCPYRDTGIEVLNCAEHREVCLEAAKKAIVLLKNENRLLPLNASSGERIAVTGPLADLWCKDWYSGIPQSAVTVWEGLQQEFGKAGLELEPGNDQIKIRYKDRYLGVGEDGSCCLTEQDRAECFEHTDWGDNRHTLKSVTLQKYLNADMDTGTIRANKPEVFSWFVEEAFSLRKEYAGDGEGSAYYRIECFNHTPILIDGEERLVFDASKGCEGSGAAAAASGSAYEAELSDNCSAPVFTFQVIREGIAEAAELARTADRVIAVMGCHPIISCKEGVDRSSLKLPDSQRKLLRKIREVNKDIILVLITNYPYAIDWEKDKLPAIIMTASGSQELGTAVAKAVSGEFSPAGRLNMTWYRNEEELLPMRDYDIIHGRRTYQYYEGEVLYPFGYGLSYTEFEYRDMEVAVACDVLKISLTIGNTGASDSDEVVQLYARQLKSRTLRPLRQLKGFQRVFFKTGEKRIIQFVLPLEELKYYDVVSGKMVLEDSDYELQAGPSSEDIRVRLQVHVDGTVIGPRDISRVTFCDHYDAYETIYLHRGHDGRPCILPADNGKDTDLPVSGAAVYNHVCFSSAPEAIVMEVKADAEGSIAVWYDDVIIASVNVKRMEEFKSIKAPVNASAVKTGEVKSLRIELTGPVRMVHFFAENQKELYPG